MEEYYQYIKDVLSGKQAASKYIKLQVERLEAFKKRDDLYFDEDAVATCFDFIRQMRHFTGEANGKPFELCPWQKWVIGSLIGIKRKEDKTRLCRELFLMVSRKQGKSSLIAALALYFLIVDGEANPSIACLASTRDQARLVYEMIQRYAQSLDPNHEALKPMRNQIKFPKNNGEVKVYSSDSSKLDGLNLSLGILDESAVQKDNLLYSVMKSSMGQRKQPLLVQISTAGFLLDGYPFYEQYKMSIEILHNIKQQDEFFPFLYVLDEDDDWEGDENCWVKMAPNLDITVSRQYLREQVQAAKNDASQRVPIMTKNFNIFCQSKNTWIPQELIVRNMDTVNLEDFEGKICYIGVDLGSVSDLTSLSVLIPDEKFYFKTFTFLPEETFKEHPNKELYRKFIDEGSLTLTPGNVTDYDYVIKKMKEINELLSIQGVFYDKWNSTSWAITCTDEGFNMVPYSQSIGTFNKPTKEFERLLKNGDIVIDKSMNVAWQYGNVVIKMDFNGNTKPDKSSYNAKIDSVISMLTALGGYLENPKDNSFFIYSL